MAVSASAEEVEALVKVEVAADNSTNGCAIAERPRTLASLSALTEKGFKTKSYERPRAATRAASTRVEDLPTTAFAVDCASTRR